MPVVRGDKNAPTDKQIGGQKNADAAPQACRGGRRRASQKTAGPLRTSEDRIGMTGSSGGSRTLNEAGGAAAVACPRCRLTPSVSCRRAG